MYIALYYVESWPRDQLGIRPYLQGEPARYTELGTYPYLETLTLFVSPPTAVSLGGRLFTKRVRV